MVTLAQRAAAASSPSLTFFFNQGSNPAALTSSGATNGTFIDSSGTVTAGTAPRTTYNPSSLINLGLLIEAARTNLEIRSATPSAANWGAATAAAYTNSTQSDPFGGTAGALITANGANTQHFINAPGLAFSNATVYTISVFAKAGTTSLIQLTPGGPVCTVNTYANFTLTGAGSSTAGSDASNVSIQAYPNGWYRIALTFTTTAATSTPGVVAIFITSTSDTRAPTNTSSSTFSVTGAQVEQASSASSFITTAAAAVTRTADVATLTFAGNRKTATVFYGSGSSAIVNNPTSPMNIGSSSSGAWVGSAINKVVIR